MRFLNPAGFLLALAVPLIILIHFKKHQIVQVYVSSLKLWEGVVKEVKGIKSNKINKYLLLLLQIMIALMFMFICIGPIITDYKHKLVTIAIDSSISMNSRKGGSTSFEIAKDKCFDYISSLPDSTKFNFVVLNSNSEILDKNISREKLINMMQNSKCTSESLNVDMAGKVLDICDGKKIVFSNNNLAIGDKNIIIDDAFDNVGITSGYYDYYSKAAYCNIKNYSKEKKNIKVTMESNSGKKKSKSISVEKGQEVSLEWQDVWKGTESIRFNIQDEDALDEDNGYYVTLGNKYKNSVLLIGHNSFLEKALESIGSINVDVKENLDIKDKKYDLYIVNKYFDFNKLPLDSNIWYTVVPKEFAGEKVEGLNRIEFLDTVLSKDMKNTDAYIYNFNALKLKGGYKKIVQIKEKTAMALYEKQNLKCLYSGIDFNKTDLPVKPSFPIFINNIIDYMLKDNLTSVQCGYRIYSDEGDAIKILREDGSDFPVNKDLMKLQKPGIYKIVNKKGEEKYITVNPPSSIAQNNTKNVHPHVNSHDNFNIDIKNIAYIILCILLIVEWEVYKRDI